MSTAKSDFRVTLALNPTYTGTPVWNATANSTLLFSRSALNVTDLGVPITTAFVSGTTNNLNEDIQTILRLGKKLTGEFDELWIIITSLGANDTYYSSLTISELV